MKMNSLLTGDSCLATINRLGVNIQQLILFLQCGSQPRVCDKTDFDFCIKGPIEHKQWCHLLLGLCKHDPLVQSEPSETTSLRSLFMREAFIRGYLTNTKTVFSHLPLLTIFRETNCENMAPLLSLYIFPENFVFMEYFRVSNQSTLDMMKHRE